MKTLLFLGDSITDCYHNYDTDGLGEGYVRMIAEHLGYGFGNVRVINKGIDGFTISALHRLWNRDSGDFACDVISILIGINDLCAIKNTRSDFAAALKEFKMNYRLLIQKIRQQFSGPIILMEPFIFPYPEEYKLWENELQIMSDMIVSLVKENNLIYIPLWDRLLHAAKETSYPRITTDGIHLTDLGHGMIAEAWLETYADLNRAILE